MKNKERKTGFTLALAVLTVSIILAASLTVFNLILSTIQFSSLGRDSQMAFYAADGGAECALFWDIRFDAFATSSTFDITCAEDADAPFTVGGLTGESSFHLDFSNGSCVDVIVYKQAYYPDTVIESRGYNTCNSGRRLERALRVTYYDWRLL